MLYVLLLLLKILGILLLLFIGLVLLVLLTPIQYSFELEKGEQKGPKFMVELPGCSGFFILRPVT